MIAKVFTVYDSKLQAYMQPFCAQTAGVAVRMFEQTVRDPNTVFAKHPGDFTLFEIGTYDDQVGAFQNLQAKIDLGNAIQFQGQRTVQGEMFPNNGSGKTEEKRALSPVDEFLVRS